MKRPPSFFRRCVNALPLRFRERQPGPARKRLTTRPTIEQLEDRLLMAGNITINQTSLLSAPITAAAGSQPDSAAILRKDDGQKLELIANYGSNTVSVYELGSNGSLTLQTTLATGQGPNGFVVGNFGNGEQDFAIAGYLDNTVSVFMGDGQGNFTLSQTLSTGSGPAGEMAGWSSGGTFYLATANYNSGTVSVFQSSGPGTFAADGIYTVAAGAIGITAGDFTGTGRTDLAVANYSNSTVTILTNQGDNTFTVGSPIGVGANPWFLTAGDFTGSGKDDLATANFYGGVSVLLSNGDDTFQNAVNYSAGSNPTGIVAADLNGDGVADLLVCNLTSNDVSFLAGNGDGTFQNAVSFAAGTGPNELAVGAIGGSGELDALVADQNGNAASVLLNQSLQGYTGQTFTGTIATLTDSDPAITSPADFSATITWSDGQTDTVGASAFSEPSPGVYTLTASHVYAVTGLYAGSVTITDTDSNTGTGSFYVGVHPAVYGTIQGTVFDDENGDGQQQASDPGLFGWTVQLLNSSSQVVATAQTATDGSYAFSNLLPGTYTVQEVLQSGWTQTAAPTESLIVDPNQVSTANFGNFQAITISGTVFDDANGDGQQEPYEAGTPGVTVQLYTEAGGVVSSNPIQTATSDQSGEYQFANLGPLAAGTSYVVAEMTPAGTNQTTPASGGNTITLPDGRIGFIVSATGGVALDPNGIDPSISGTGTYTLNSLADSVTATIGYNDGQGHADSANLYVSPFNITFNNGVNAGVNFTSFCIDLFDRVETGGTYPVAVRTDEATAFTNGARMAYLTQTFGTENMSTNQAVALQIALWDLSLNNHNPTSFGSDGDGTYSSGDPTVFSVANLSTNSTDTAEIVQDVNEFLGISAGIDPPGAFLGTLGTGQSLTVPNQTNNFGNFTPPAPITPTPGGQPGQLIQQNPNLGTTGPNRGGSCQLPVDPEDGQGGPSVTPFGTGGQDPMSLTLTWINGNYASGSNMGSGVNNSLTPSIVPVNGTNTVAVLIGGSDALYFDGDGTNYTERYAGQDQLTYNPSTMQFTLIDTMGDKFTFWGLDPSLPAGQQGDFQSMTDPGGNVTQVTARTATGQIADMQRSTTVNATTTTESLLYSYVGSGVDAGLVQNITLRRSTDGGDTWSTVRQAVFTYYDGTQPYGNVGDLEFLSVEDGAGNVLGTNYYRYYTPADAGSGGYVGGLKYFFSEQSYARLAAAVGDPTTATDSQVSGYADDYLQYDSQHRITETVVQGEGCSTCSAGLGAFTYSYTASYNAASYNSWAVKTIETSPDGSVDTIYSNAYGEIMLDAFTDATTGITTDTFNEYDDSGRVILTASPSAVTGYDDSYADLLHNTGGTYQYLSTTSGLIDLTSYYTSTTATETTPGGVAGYVQSDSIEQGQSGTPILQDTTTYFLHTGGGASYAPTATYTVYRNDDGTGAETTSYAYTFYANSTQIESMTTTLPVISPAQNGPGVADQMTTFFDSFGRDVWDKDADGYLTYTAYDPATGAVVESITDVNTADTSEFQNLPAGWQTPPGGGLNLVTTFQVDNIGRTVEEIDPKDTITYTTFDDVNHEVRTYVGWNSTTGMPTGPTQVYREDWANGYTETLTMSAVPHLTDGVPDGTEPISDVQTLSRSYTNTAGQVVREDDYFFLGSTVSVDDAGFEAPAVGTGSYGDFQYDPTGTAWTFTGGAGVAGNGSGFTSGNPDAPEGTQVGFLQETGSFSQAVTFAAAGSYTISFSAAQRHNYQASSQTFEVLVDGTVVGTFTPGSTSYASFTTNSFAVTAGSHTVEFLGLNPNGGDNTAFVDAVSIQQPNTVTYSTAPYIGTVNVNYYTTAMAYDSAGRLDKTVSPTGTINRTVFDGRGDAISAWVGTNDTPASGFWSPSNPAGMTEVSSFVFDNGGVGDDNLTQETDFPGGSAAPRVTQYFFDWRDRQVAEKDGVQATETDGTNRPIYFTTFDNLDEAVSQAMYTGDSVNIATVDGVPQAPDASLLRAYSTIAYDDQGRMFQTNTFDVNPTTGAVSTNSLTTNDFYDHRGDLVAESDPGGLWTKMQFDGAGRETFQFTTDGGAGTTWADANSVSGDIVLEQVQTVYDPNSNPIETIDTQREPNTIGNGPLLIMGTEGTGPFGRTYYSGTYYDLADRPVADVNVGTNGGTAWVMPSTVPARSDTALVTSYTYDAAGWLQSTTDPRGLVDEQTYDGLDRLTQDVQNFTDGVPTTDSNQTTQYTYDGENNVLTLTAVQPTGTPSQTTQYVYGVTTASGSAINSNDLLAATLYPDQTTGQPSTSQEETYTYNALGQVTSMTDRNGNVHQYSYDVLGRQTSDTVTTLGAGVDGSVRRIDTAYDKQGNAYLFTSYADTAGTTVVNQVQRTFNGLGQLTAEYQSISGPVDLSSTPSVQYAYTEMSGGQNNSRMVSMTYPNGRVLNYNYNSGLDSTISRLSSISDSSGILEAYKYLGLGTVVERDHPQTGVNETFISQTNSTGDAGDTITGLDRFGRIVEDAWYDTQNASFTDDFLYTYDRDSNALTRTNALDAAFSQSYAYNGLNELTGYTQGDGSSQDYGLDALGNMTSVTTDGNTQTRTANAQNEYTSVTGGATPTYDQNGNLTTDPTTGNQFTYDAWNRLVSVSNGGTTLATYQYDATGRRTIETKAGTSTDLFYNGQWQVIEQQVAGQTTAQNVWSPFGSDKLVLRDTNPDGNGNLTQRVYVQQDMIGNVTVALDAAGNVLARFVYTPFGQQSVYDANWNPLSSSPVDLPYGFQGYRTDFGLNLADARARVFVIGLERFAQNDPRGFGGGQTNLYAFVGDNPVNGTDPSGESELEYMPMVNGRTRSVYYRSNDYHIYVYVGELNPTTEMVERAGYRLPLATVQREEERWYPTGTWTVTEASWEKWFKNNKNATKVGEQQPLTASSFESQVTAWPGEGPAVPNQANIRAQTFHQTQHLTKTAMHFYITAPFCATAGVVVWQSIKATQPVYEGTVIPRSFEIAAGESRFWVGGNATKHMAQYAEGALARGLSAETVKIGTQMELTSLQGALEAAGTQGYRYDTLFTVGGWELKIGAPREAGQLPAVYHARYVGGG